MESWICRMVAKLLPPCFYPSLVKSRAPVWPPPYSCFTYSVPLHCSAIFLVQQPITAYAHATMTTVLSPWYPMPATIVQHAATTPSCHRPLPKWHEHLHHRTVVSSNKGAPPHRLSPLRVASTWATTSRRPPFSPALVFELTPAIFIVSSISSIFPINVKKRQAPLAVGVSPRLSLKLVYWWLVPTSQRRSSRREQQEVANPTSPTMDRFLEMCDSECWDIATVYICFAPLLCLFLAFHVYIHHLLPHERRWCCERKPMFLSPSLNLASSRVWHALLVFSMQALPFQKGST
jgi:hypothetical protein